MAVKVMIPTPLRAYAGKQASVDLQAGTVAEALAGLTAQFGELKRHLFTDDGRLRSCQGYGEEHNGLAHRVRVEVLVEGDEVQVRGVDHYLNGEEKAQRVLLDNEAVDADRKEQA